MKRTLCLGLFMVLTLAGNALAADDGDAGPADSKASSAETCTEIVLTGHPQYPAIAFKDGDRIAGAAPALAEAIAKDLDIPIQSKFTGTWAEAQAATRDGGADMIVGIYRTDKRAEYLDYIRPAFTFDPVVAFVATEEKFPFTGPDDLIGKRGAANKGESFGTKFDAFIEHKLLVKRTNGIDDALNDLVSGKVDYVLAGYYPGVAGVERLGIEGKVEPLEPALLSAEMFIAFSKASPCAALGPEFARALAKMTSDGRFKQILLDAIAAWDAGQKKTQD